MAIISLNPDELTDKEKGVEDHTTRSVLPQDILGTIDVFQKRKNVDNDISDNSNDEPLDSKRTGLTFATQRKPILHTWHPPQSPAFQQNSVVYDRAHQIREKLKNRKIIDLC